MNVTNKFLTLLFLAGCTPANNPVEAVDLTIAAPAELVKTKSATGPEAGHTYNYCDPFIQRLHPGLADCQPCPSSGPCPPDGTTSVLWCCTPAGVCVEIQLLTSCSPADYVLICTWGRSNTDGSITCFD